MATMRYPVVLTIGVHLLFSSVPAMADQSEDEAAIREVWELVGAGKCSVRQPRC